MYLQAIRDMFYTTRFLYWHYLADLPASAVNTSTAVEARKSKGLYMRCPPPTNPCLFNCEVSTMKQPNAVLFDLDGTLRDASNTSAECWNAALTAQKIELRLSGLKYLLPPICT